MLRVALIGCGKIADLHLAAIRRISDAEVVSVCDRELLMAQQLAERFQIRRAFDDAAAMLAEMKPDVVHITTPPQSHFSLGRICLDAGCHIYIEKPFTIDAEEAELLFKLAENRGLKITAGHNLQFTLEMLRLREQVRKGFLGERPTHLESYFSYNLDDTTYLGPVLNSRSHWVRRLPGQLFHNIVSHGISKLAEFLDDDLVEVVADGHQSEKLKAKGGEEVLDELRVMIRDGKGTTASFCFSTQISPGRNEFRVSGPKGSLLVDHTTGSLVVLRPRLNKSYLTYVVPPLFTALEWAKNAIRNISDFLGQRLYQDAGTKELIDRFYRSIVSNATPPIPYREILLTARIMDRIFAQVYPRAYARSEQRAAV